MDVSEKAVERKRVWRAGKYPHTNTTLSLVHMCDCKEKELNVQQSRVRVF